MSGDHGLRVSIPASIQALQTDTRLHIHLVGDADAIKAGLPSQLPARASILHAPDIIPMEARPSAVLRQSDNSSMRLALNLLAEKKVSGVVSAGNAGALMALARLNINMLPGFSRPAFCSVLPTGSGYSYLLDLGANVDCNGAQLHEFAAMGAALAGALHGVVKPRVALLSNGREAGKGNAQIQAARQLLLNDERVNFVGFVEGDDLYDGLADVIVCDGLLGNVVLKGMEGTARMLAKKMESGFRQSPWRRFLAMLSKAALNELREDMNPELHNGAFLLGLQGVVVKSHGASNARSFAAALGQASLCVQHDMVAGMNKYLGNQ